MQLLKRLKNKPFCNDMHFYLFAVILFYLSINYYFFYIPLIIYLIFIYKKVKLLIPTIIILLLIILRIVFFNVNTIKYKDEYIIKITEVEDNGYIAYIDTVKLKVLADDFKYKPGDLIKCNLEIIEINEKSYEADFNYSNYLKSEGIKHLVKFKNDEYIKSDMSFGIIKYNINNYFKNSLSNNTYKYVEAIVLADNNLEDDLKEGYSILGISHILAISGLHIMLLFKLLSFILFKVFKIYKRSVSIIIISIYVFIIDFPKACLRALLFLILKNLNNYGSIKYTSLDILSISFIIMLFINPYNIYSSGFILSYLVSFILIFLNEIIKVKNKLFKMYLDSIIIYFLTLPIIISFNNCISIFSIIFSPILSLVVTVIIIPLSYISAAFPVLDLLICHVFNFINEYILGITANALIINIESFDIFRYVIYYCLFILLLISIIKNKKIIKWLSIFIFYLLLLINLKSITPYHKITFIDVGQGDSTLIELAYNKGNVLIDAYNSLDYLKSSGISKIDYLVLTHSDNDHIRDALDIIKFYNIKNILYSIYDDGFSEFEGVGIKFNNDFYIGNVKFDVLAPINSYLDANSNSIVIKLVLNNFSFLFTGDMTVKEEKDIIKQNKYILDSDVLKVGHHGSKTSTSDEFLNYVSPNYSIVSVAKNNFYGLPDDSIIDKLNNVSIVYQTKDNGNIVIKIFKNKMWVLPYR